MTFVASAPPGITESLPFALSAVDEGSAVASRGQIRWDLSVDGMGFVLGVNDEDQYIRESAPVQKEQFDSSSEAGEQSLAGFWLRSQTSWHLGAGINFYEPGAREGLTPSQYRFKESVGCDVWTQGEVSLLRKATLDYSSASSTVFVTGAYVAGTGSVIFINRNGTVERRGGFGPGTYGGTTSATTRVAVAGSTILVGRGTFIWSGAAGGLTLASQVGPFSADVVPYWAKSRIIAAAGRHLYELALGATVVPAALHSHPDTAWTWVGVAETPTAILAAGRSGGQSAIYAFTLETDTGSSTPKLGAAFQVAEMPQGEYIETIHTYLGTYVGIGTNLGLRVGVVGSDGQIQYGPLLFEVDDGVKALTARDRFLYAGVGAEIDGGAGVARIDLSAQIGDSLVFPWAWDVQTHATGQVTTLAFEGRNDKLALGVPAEGIYLQSATEREATGYLLSGGIRFSTTEGKSFRYADVNALCESDSTVVASVVDPGGSELTLATLTSTTQTRNLSLSRVTQGLEYLRYKVTLNRATDLTTSPVLESVAIKAVPQVRKQRVIQYPVMLQDKVHDAGGRPVSQNVAERIALLEGLEDDKAVVTVVDYRLQEQFSAVIEMFQFRGTTPTKGRPGSQNNVGGRGVIRVRKI